jgi:hypothetical protein
MATKNVLTKCVLVTATILDALAISCSLNATFRSV